ncbi:helix-turn-helix domain-containing protein [Brevibacterium casei]|uniref:helix-turn-helix domain-containing protein n=1 Tax=Brevibacterium casei TaxID=33889 RepID=UPI0039F08DFA
MQQDSGSPDVMFGQAVSEFRKTQELSQRDLADRLRENGLNLDASAVSRIENGSRSVRISEASVIADVLDVELTELFRYSWTPKRMLRSGRRRANRMLHDTEDQIAELMSMFASLHSLLDANPDLLATLIDEGQEPPTSANDYFTWTLRRLEKWEDDAEEAVLFPSAKLRNDAVALVTQLAEGVTSTVDGKILVRPSENG